VLSHLPEILESPIVFVCEGEKDCETLRSHGFVATTNAGGAKARWLPEFTEALRGPEVIIVPDNDGPGWERAAVVAKALIGSAVSIRVHDLPQHAKDISAWFAAGHRETELIAILEGVHAI
jgi:putative DNA primase/helicase